MPSRKSLFDLLPDSVAARIAAWAEYNMVTIKVSKPRSTKLGDYRPATSTNPARITVNENLEYPWLLITLVHEMAHHEAQTRSIRRIKPHGPEWREAYLQLIPMFLHDEISLHTEQQLVDSLLKGNGAFRKMMLPSDRTMDHDTTSEVVPVSSIREGTFFRFGRGHIYKLLGKKRSRYHCIRLANRRIYSFHPLVRVKPIDNELNR